MILGNRRYWVIKVKNINNDKLEELGELWIKQLWLQAYNETKYNFQKFRLNSEETALLNKRNYEFNELSPCEEELTLNMDFSGNTSEVWNSVEINEFILNNKYSSPIIGKTIAKLKIKFPNLIDIKQTNKGKAYTLPIKKVMEVKVKK